MRRYASARHLLHHSYGLVLLLVVLANLLLWWPPALAGILVLDLAFGAGVLAIRRSHRWTWREFAFQLHAVPYSLVRHVGFVAGFLRLLRSPSSYPSGERIILERDLR